MEKKLEIIFEMIYDARSSVVIESEGSLDEQEVFTLCHRAILELTAKRSTGKRRALITLNSNKLPGFNEWSEEKEAK
jgi:hypothetical protein